MIKIIETKRYSKVLIQENITKDEQKQLIKIIKNSINLELTLIDIENISSTIILQLQKHKSKVSLHTNTKTLWLYLKKLFFDISMNYERNNFRVQTVVPKAIGIGGSAGSLANIEKVIRSIPYSDLSIFIVIHILPTEKSRLIDIFNNCTNYTVKEPVNGEKVEKGHIYVAKPDLHMSIENGRIYNLRTNKVKFCRPSVDVLFQSLSQEYKESLITVITCGYLDDGSSSLELVKENRGISIIQNPNQCEANEMPLNAIMTKNYDHILNIEQISEFIIEKLNFVFKLEDRINSFLTKVKKVHNYDFSNYERSSIIRRIELLRQELNIDNFSDFENLILNDTFMFEQLFKKISINVSEFFRDSDMFESLIKDILPQLSKQTHIRIWCSACSKGQEAYSIGIVLDKLGLLGKSIIYATDINGLIIDQGKNGLFSLNEYETAKKNYSLLGDPDDLDHYFINHGDFIEIEKKIKKKVHFFQHNLVVDGEINEFQLVFCRNVLIYFNESLQQRVLELIYNSLTDEGIMILGNSERIHSKKFTNLKTIGTSKIYKKSGGK
ncbi:MAG: chemotaxis protein CheB [Campylobacterota bacterium]|nr:chemotaxis protein CheB [Campylobacterota bacterium]